MRKTAIIILPCPNATGRKPCQWLPFSLRGKIWNICRAALNTKDADCTLLSCIPFPDVQKEGIKKFSAGTPAFVLYSFAGITDAEMARDAVKADAYCLQFVPEKLMTSELCQMALKSPNADEKVLKFVRERFPELQPKNEKPQQKAGVRIKF